MTAHAAKRIDEGEYEYRGFTITDHGGGRRFAQGREGAD